MNKDSEARAALIIPALNEAESIAATLNRIPEGLFRTIIVADNGSTDRTAEIANRCGAKVVREPRRGYGAACLRALEAVPEGVEAVVFLQADASEDAGESTRLLSPILDGRADLVIGSRALGLAEKGSLAAHQLLGNRLSVTLIRLLYGYSYSDLGPFRAIRMSALRRLDMRDRDYGWTAEMQVRALQCGLRVMELPVHSYRRTGRSKVTGTLRGSILAGAKILWTVFRLRFSGPCVSGSAAHR
jgi:glycosyltransferase involved in cell wall biosynthesis